MPADISPGVNRRHRAPASQGPLCVGLIATLLALCPPVAAQEISLNGFGDVNYGFRAGDPANAEDAENFEAFGEDLFPKSSQIGFGLAGTDFTVTVDLPADIVYLGEINLQVGRGGQSEFELDVERMFIGKRFVPEFNLQLGLFFTPVGYFNRTLYSRAFLMTSVQIPDLFEEELGLVPTHTIGLLVQGQFSLPAMHNLQYMVSLGNGRAADPVAAVYARDDDGWRSITANLEWWIPWANEFRIGFGGWFDRIESYRVLQLGEVRSIQDPSTESMTLRELGLDAYVVLKTVWVNAMVEGVYQQHEDADGNLPDAEADTHLWGLMAELSANLGPEGAIKPYVRYDYVVLPPDAGPYLGLRRDDDEITRVYVPETSLGMLGVAWDLAANVRLKLEYSHAFTGPRQAESVVAQASFAF